MDSSKIKKIPAVFKRSYVILSLASLCALLATFAVSNSDVKFQTKLATFVAIVAGYLALCAWIWLHHKTRLAATSDKNKFGAIYNDEIEAKLLALEEASQFFGASLNTADMFRFIVSRVNEIIPFAAGALCLADEKKKKLKIAYVAGDDLKKIVGSQISSPRAAAWKAFQNRRAVIDDALRFDKSELSVEAFQGLNCAVAVPLFDGAEVYGVFVIYGKRENEFKPESLPLYEAIGTRIAPLLLSARTFENSLTNALTDALTNLPNERAFFLVLENQIAESQRFLNQRPLTILTIDIKSFGEHNERFGHATGDLLLLFVAGQIKNQLRQMDFLARTADDEFLAVLPTASEEIAREVVERLEKTFVINPFEVSDEEKIHLALNFGAASFGNDGETADQLLKHARLRKQQSKSIGDENKILWFQKDYLN